MPVLSVAAGGALGAACRFLLSRLPRLPGGWPLPTFLANLIGCFLMGAFCAEAEARGWDPHLVLFLRTGFCGGLTTFSAFSEETLALTRDGKIAHAAFYAAATILLGLCAVYLGGKWAK